MTFHNCVCLETWEIVCDLQNFHWESQGQDSQYGDMHQSIWTLPRASLFKSWFPQCRKKSFEAWHDVGQNQLFLRWVKLSDYAILCFIFQISPFTSISCNFPIRMMEIPQVTIQARCLSVYLKDDLEPEMRRACERPAIWEQTCLMKSRAWDL